MRINRNMTSVRANKQLLRTENKLATSVERLSSGYKINKAGDNPAGIAISNKMRAQIDALDRAQSNATDGTNVLQIADGALSEVSDILQRIRELSVQAANGTNAYSERESLQAEVNELVKEVDRISRDTEFNTKTLLDGSSDVRIYADGASRIEVSDTVTSGIYELNVAAAATQGSLTIDISQLAIGEEGSISINEQDVKIESHMTEDEIYEAILTAATIGECEVERDPDDPNQVTIRSEEYGAGVNLNVIVSNNMHEAVPVATYDAEIGNYVANVQGTDAEVDLTVDPTIVTGFSETASVSVDGNRITVIDRDGFSMDFLLNNGFTGDLSLEVTEIGPMTMQIGANQYQTVEVRIPEVSSKSLYLDTVDIKSVFGAEKAMDTLDDAIVKVSAVRSRIGASQNRLEHAINSLSETEENMTAAYSGIMDTDMAEEMTEYTQQNVLNQAGVSVLAQANDLPQQILSLLQ